MTNKFRLEDIEIEKIGKPEIKGSYEFKKQSYLKQDRTFGPCPYVESCPCQGYSCNCDGFGNCRMD